MTNSPFLNFKLNRRFAVSAMAQTALSLIATPSWAQGTWPQRPLKWIVSQPAGAGPDILARYIAEQLSKALGQPVVVENRPGGQNVIGTQAAARSAPDGYTFFYGTTAAMVTNAFTFKSLPYDPDKDFVPVTLLGRSPFVIAASASSGLKTLTDALAQAKAQPGQLAIATEGPKTFAGMLADSVAALANVKFNHVPYSKAPDAIQDVLGGRVPLICLPDAALAAYLKGGQMVALAVSTAQRVPNLPGVPSLADTFAGFDYAGWNGLFAPAGTPADVVARVNRELGAILKQPDVIQRLQALGSLADGSMDPVAFAGFMKAERERWAGIVKAIGIVAE
jgi:tripartite-type tricarboxylate transporter receptor subunit TctC